MNFLFLKIPEHLLCKIVSKFIRTDRLRLSIKGNWTTLCYQFSSVCYNRPYSRYPPSLHSLYDGWQKSQDTGISDVFGIGIFFFICLPPEKLRRVTFKRVQRWRVSWIRSIAGAGNDLGKRTKLNFSYTLGSLLKSVAVVSFILENAVFNKFFHDKSSKTTIELIRFNLHKCVFAFNERESLLFESFPRGIYNVPRVLLWMTYDFTVWTPSWTDWLAAISIASISTLASSVYWRALLIQKSAFVVRFQLISSQEKLHSDIWILCYVNNGFGTLYLLLWIRPTSA